MRRLIKRYMSTEKMPQEGTTVVVGFSGGADSVALLHILHNLDYRCIAAHCNFHLRGEESLRDEQFAASFANSIGVPFLKIDFNTENYASENKISIEMAARDLRYQWFEQVMAQEKAEKIAVAHHQDDNVETLILNLIRGSGLKGLTAIKPIAGNVIRPLLCVTKDEIISYLKDEGLDYVTDSSNLSDEFTRNKIRNQVIPLLQTINPSISNTLSRTINILQKTHVVYEQAIKNAENQLIHRGKIPIPPPKDRILYEAYLAGILATYGFNHDVINEITDALDNQSGKQFYSGEYRLTKERDHLYITRRKENEKQEYSISKEDRFVGKPVKIEISYHKRSDITISKEKNKAYFDAGKLQYPLVLRKWQNGDRFIPFGMNQFKKLSDYFTDHKYSLENKEEAWILCSGKDICWLVGERPDNRFRVDENTNTVGMFNLLQK